MASIELLERLAGLTAGLQPTAGASEDDVSELRALLACALRESTRRPGGLEELPSLLVRRDPATLAPDLLKNLESALSEEALAASAAALPSGARISRRTVPFLSSAEVDSVPSWGAGRRIDRTLGPFVDADGRFVWFDIFLPVRQASLVRSPSSTPFLTLPLRGFLIGSATEYDVPAGSVWMQSSLFTSGAPAGGYSGLRVKGGKLRLSAAPSVSGNTIVVGSGTRVRLTLELDPAASAAPAPEPGKDALAAVVELSQKVAFEFTAGGGSLTGAKDASVKVFGSGVALRYAPGSVSYESLINRILFPFDFDPAEFTVTASDSQLLHLGGTAPVGDAGWALPVAVVPADELGDASGAGALALRIKDGLKASWRGLAGGPARAGSAILMAETDRVALVAENSLAPGAMQRLRLWDAKEGASPCEASLGFDRFRLRFESLAGRADIVVAAGKLEASTDRPVATNGRPFTLRSANATSVFWQDPSAFRVLIQAPLHPPPGVLAKSIALKNALVTVPPPVWLALLGELPTPEDVADATLALVFRAWRIMLTLPDPYVTSQRLPDRFRGRESEYAAVGFGPLLISLVRWQRPDNARLDLALLFPPSQVPGTAATTAHMMAQPSGSVLPEDTSDGGDEPSGAGFYSMAAFPRMSAVDLSGLPDPAKSEREDAQATQDLRAIFEESAGGTRESLFLLDVSSNIDHLGVGWGYLQRDERRSLGAGFPLQIDGLALVTPGRHVRLFLLPQFQWEPLRNLPNPNIGFYPDRLVSGDDGGATLFGSNTVRLVPIAPDRVLVNLVDQFDNDDCQVGASFTLPFGIRAAAQLLPEAPAASRWAKLALNRPAAPGDSLKGAYQLTVTAHASSGGPSVESPSLAGAAWQTRNGVDPITGAPNGFSALRGDILNEGVEAFFNQELGPGSPNRRVPVTRLDFAGLGASAFSKWFNPNAVAGISQVRFDVFVGRTAYEVVQAASVLYPWAVPVVRTITIERRKEGLVCRADSGWVATGPGIYRYPDVDPNAKPPPPPTWTKIETHPGVVRGAYNVRRIRETGRVVERVISGETIELLEVRFDADMEIEGVVRGQINGTERVPSIDQVGFVQREPKGYPLVPRHLAEILADEGPMGGPVDCEIEVAGSGQLMRIVRVDVDATDTVPATVPEFAAAARGALFLPEDGAWSVARRQTSAEEYEPVDPISGTPLIRQGRASDPAAASKWRRFSDPQDLLREANPEFEFGLLQSSDGHQFLLPRPRIQGGGSAISTTEQSLLADAYARATAAGLFPKRSSCFASQGVLSLNITPQGRYKLGPSPTANFNNIPGGERQIVDGDALAIRTRYAGPIRYMLDPDDPEVWSVAIDTLTTAMDLGPFDELMGVRHDFRVSDALPARLINPTQEYAPFLAPVVEIVKFLTELLGIDDTFDVDAVQSSFKFQATAQYPIEGPGNSHIDFGAMKIKGKLQTGFGWSEKDHWFGFFKAELGMKIVVNPPIFANGKTELELKGTKLNGSQITIRLLWGTATEPTPLGPFSVSAELWFGIEVIVADSPSSWQIGLLVQIVGKAEILIVTVAVKIELLAAIGRLPAPSTKVEAIAKAKFSAEIQIAWFLTISIEYSIEYRGELNI